MRRYETIYIIRPTVTEDDINTIIDRTNDVIEKADGSIVQLDRWGLKKLAYLIKKENQGYYVFTEYAGTPEAVAELERLFRIDENILRYMTIKTQDAYIPDTPKAVVEETEDVTDDAAAQEAVSE
ncbi:MAG: 30S ribosomal protein S6 [Deltaproteobacteria bacterium]|nr:30S ribosomal protein S6 [Deltaproteobacteria bacterium]